MNKMAMFVEGYTEQEFVTRLIQEIANQNEVQIEWRRITGGTTCKRRSQLIKTHTPDQQHEHFIVVYDCGNDELVKSRMREEYANLAKSGYSSIICIRDVYPQFSHSELSKLEQGLPLYVKTKPIVVNFILSVMEIEAWFLAEHRHFEKIDPAITVGAIVAALNFDPSKDDMQLRPEPRSDLNDCYQISGKTYQKQNAKRTVSALDFASVYFELVEKFPHVKRLCDGITTFLAPGTL